MLGELIKFGRSVPFIKACHGPIAVKTESDLYRSTQWRAFPKGALAARHEQQSRSVRGSCGVGTRTHGGDAAGAVAQSFPWWSSLSDYSELFIQAFVYVSVHVALATVERRVWLRPV